MYTSHSCKILLSVIGTRKSIQDLWNLGQSICVECYQGCYSVSILGNPYRTTRLQTETLQDQIEGITRIVPEGCSELPILSAFCVILTELLGFKLKLHNQIEGITGEYEDCMLT